MSTIDFSHGKGLQATERLETERTGWIVTTNALGVPQPSPVWFVWEDGAIVVYSKPKSAKLGNIRQNPNVAFMFNTNELGSDVTIFTGEARIVEGKPGAESLPSYVSKYSGMIEAFEDTSGEKVADYSTRIEITPKSLRAW